MPKAPEGRSDASVLGVLGAAFFAAGLALLIFGSAALSSLLPPTLNSLGSALFGLGFGLAFLIVGFMYTLIARTSDELEVSEQGLSLTRDPLTGAREWIKIDKIEAATVRRWALSPWFKDARYVEVEITVKEGDLTVDEDFFVHLGSEPAPVLERLRKALGSRLTLSVTA